MEDGALTMEIRREQELLQLETELFESVNQQDEFDLDGTQFPNILSQAMKDNENLASKLKLAESTLSDTRRELRMNLLGRQRDAELDKKITAADYDVRFLSKSDKRVIDSVEFLHERQKLQHLALEREEFSKLFAVQEQEMQIKFTSVIDQIRDDYEKKLDEVQRKLDHDHVNRTCEQQARYIQELTAKVTYQQVQIALLRTENEKLKNGAFLSRNRQLRGELTECESHIFELQQCYKEAMIQNEVLQNLLNESHLQLAVSEAHIESANTRIESQEEHRKDKEATLQRDYTKQLRAQQRKISDVALERDRHLRDIGHMERSLRSASGGSTDLLLPDLSASRSRPRLPPSARGNSSRRGSQLAETGEGGESGLTVQEEAADHLQRLARKQQRTAEALRFSQRFAGELETAELQDSLGPELVALAAQGEAEDRNRERERERVALARELEVAIERRSEEFPALTAPTASVATNGPIPPLQQQVKEQRRGSLSMKTDEAVYAKSLPESPPDSPAVVDYDLFHEVVGGVQEEKEAEEGQQQQLEVPSRSRNHSRRASLEGPDEYEKAQSLKLLMVNLSTPSSKTKIPRRNSKQRNSFSRSKSTSNSIKKLDAALTARGIELKVPVLGDTLEAARAHAARGRKQREGRSNSVFTESLYHRKHRNSVLTPASVLAHAEHAHLKALHNAVTVTAPVGQNLLPKKPSEGGNSSSKRQRKTRRVSQIVRNGGEPVTADQLQVTFNTSWKSYNNYSEGANSRRGSTIRSNSSSTATLPLQQSNSSRELAVKAVAEALRQVSDESN